MDKNPFMNLGTMAQTIARAAREFEETSDPQVHLVWREGAWIASVEHAGERVRSACEEGDPRDALAGLSHALTKRLEAGSENSSERARSLSRRAGELTGAMKELY